MHLTRNSQSCWQTIEKFVTEHIEARKSFAIETTLRTDVTFRQAELAKKAGFRIEMFYVSGGDFDGTIPKLALEATGGKIGFMEEPVPVWLAAIIEEH